MTDLIERLRAEVRQRQYESGDMLYLGAPDPLLTEAADEIAALRARVKALEAQLLAKKDADLDRHIFAWFNDLDCDEMRRCLEDYDARQQRAEPEPEYSGRVEVVDEGEGGNG